jgi:hypothetical protein
MWFFQPEIGSGLLPSIMSRTAASAIIAVIAAIAVIILLQRKSCTYAKRQVI